MAEGERIKLADAQELAAKWLDKLRPFCLRAEIAGSVRRQKPDIGDLEICITAPQVPSDSRFLELAHVIHNLPRFKGDFLERGKLGKYVQINIGTKDKPMKLDLFICTPATWGLVYMIRTGSADFSHAMAAHGRDLGYCWDGGRVHQAGAGGKAAGQPLETPEEADAFAVLGVPWVEPIDRTDAKALVRVLQQAGRNAGPWLRGLARSNQAPAKETTV